MKTLGWIILAALLALAFFTIANWTLFTAPATLDFLVFSVQGPLGLVLLGIMLLLAALFAVYALSLRTAALVETRRHVKEMQTQRELADKAEASRFTALGEQLERELGQVRSSIDESRAATLARVEALEGSLEKRLDDTANALFANIGQVDDKLNRLAPPAAGPRS